MKGRPALRPSGRAAGYEGPSVGDAATVCQAAGRGWVPQDRPTEHATPLVSQMSQAQSPALSRNVCCFLSGMGWGGGGLEAGTQLLDPKDKVLRPLQGPPCRQATLAFSTSFLRPC